MKKSKRLVLTGGHAGGMAYAVIQTLKKNKTPWDIYWIGVKKAVEGGKTETYESQVFPKLGIKFYAITAGRLQRKFTPFTLVSLMKVPVGFVSAFILLLRIKPSVVLSFGGYAAFPVVVCAWSLRIPVIIHEQTAAAGRANIMSALFAKKIALARVTSRKYFPSQKIIITGNPLSEDIKKISIRKTLSNPPRIFITGGSRGSKTLNDIIFSVIAELVKKYKVVHQTGELSFAEAKIIQKGLGKLSGSYEVWNFIPPETQHRIMGDSDLVISRAGATTLSELTFLKRPCILVPIPFSYLDEQTKNARVLEQVGLARIIKQEDLSSEALLKNVEEIFSNYSQIKSSIEDSGLNLDANASELLVKMVEEEVK